MPSINISRSNLYSLLPLIPPELPNVFGWGGFGYLFDQRQFVCNYKRLLHLWYTAAVSVIGIYIPLPLIGLCYALIYRHVRRAQRKVAPTVSRVEGNSNNIAGKSLSSGRLRRESRLLRTFFTIFVAFAACWLPYSLVTVADVHDRFPIQLHAFTVLICHTNSALNCIIYAASNKQFRSGYARLLGCGEDLCLFF